MNRELGVTLVVMHPFAARGLQDLQPRGRHRRMAASWRRAPPPPVFGNPQSPVTRELLANDDMLAAIERDAEKVQEG